jgi:lysyl-tRNA synthetase, class II
MILEKTGVAVDRPQPGESARRRATPESNEPARWSPRPPSSRALVARLVQLAGVMDAALTVLPTWHHRFPMLAELMPTVGVLTARAAAGVVGVLLVYLGAGLRRGKHRAWQLAVGLSAVSAFLHVLKGFPGAAALSLTLCFLLIWKRHQFTTIGDLRNRWRALRACALFLGSGFVLGFAEIAVRVNRLVGDPGVVKWAEHAALGLIGISGPVRFQYPMGASAVSVTTGSFGLVAFAVAALLLLRPGTRRHQPTGEDEARVRAILDRHGSADSLGYFALRRDKLQIWSPSGKAVISYRVVNGVSLAAGDPLGPPSAWPDAIGAWLKDCAVHGWTPAVLACGTPGGNAYRRAGLDIIELGDEAIVDVEQFSLQGRPMRGVRQAVARMRRAGYRCETVHRHDLTPEVLAEVVQCAGTLRDGKVERGFSMALSRLGQAADDKCLFVLCRDADGGLRGVLHFVPWGSDGLSLDLMRGDRGAVNGLTELMIVSAIEGAAELGVRRISLNFAVLRSVFARAEQLGAGPVIRLWARLLRLGSRFWQIESLYRANAKYQPNWQPRFLCFPSARDLPRIAIAVLHAESFLPQRISR